MENKNTKRSVKIWMDPDDYKGLRLMAFVSEVSMSELVRKFIRVHIDKARESIQINQEGSAEEMQVAQDDALEQSMS